MDTQRELQRIARLTEADIGPTEENVKQKIVVPLLELLGHPKQDMEFEYHTRSRGKIDIYIKDVPHDCKVIIDTKGYGELLQNPDYVDQIKGYTFDEGALLAVLANGKEIRVYSPLRGIAFERSLLYVISREDLPKEAVWKLLNGLLGRANLLKRQVLENLNVREKEIKHAISSEEELRRRCQAELEGIESDIEAKEEEIEQLRDKAGKLNQEIQVQVVEIWKRLGLPLDRSDGPPPSGGGGGGELDSGRARKVRLEELVQSGLLRDGERVYLYYQGRGRIVEEQAKVVASQNKLRYDGDGKLYSTSELARMLLKKRGVISGNHGVGGPLYWQTEGNKTLHELNEQVRAIHARL